MSAKTYPEFDINYNALASHCEELTEHDNINDRIIGLREKLNFYYREYKQFTRQVDIEREKHDKQVDEILLDYIHVANKFVDTLRMFEENKELKKQTFARDCILNTYDELKDVMEKWGLCEVPVMDKQYKDVEYEGVNIPEPWEVVAAQKKSSKADSGGKKVGSVIRPLWIRLKKNKIKVLQRAKVSY